jgi:membrane glycosyltransferase
VLLTLAFRLDHGVALWLAPVALPLVLALPVAVLSGAPARGRWLRRAGLLLTPEETAPPLALRRAWAEAAVPESSPPIEVVLPRPAARRQRAARADRRFAQRPMPLGADRRLPLAR